jgi:putative hydrolase of the HAD superfamily
VSTDRPVVFWDFENTLARRDGGWTVSLHRVLARNGITDIPVERLRPHLQTGFPWQNPDVPHARLFDGLSWWDYVGRLLTGAMVKTGVDDARAAALASQFREEYLDLACWSLYEDTIDALSALHAAGCANCILSNHVPELQLLVDGLGLAPHIEQVFTSGLLGYEKPNERVFQMARAAMDDPSECFMVGDGYRGDVMGAAACGMRAVLVRTANEQGCPDYSEDLPGAARIILGWLQPRQDHGR